MDINLIAKHIRIAALYVREEAETLARAGDKRQNAPAIVGALRAHMAHLSRLVDDFEAAPLRGNYVEAAPVPQAAE